MTGINKLIESKLLKIANDMLNFHTLTPSELEQLTSIDAKEWHHLINNNEQVRQLIHRRTNEDIEIAQRKALQSLAKAAQHGNVQAIKELNQVSGILNQSNNKQFITHYVKRPETEKEAQPDDTTTTTTTNQQPSTTTTNAQP
jgi:hypothetical protein